MKSNAACMFLGVFFFVEREMRRDGEWEMYYYHGQRVEMFSVHLCEPFSLAGFVLLYPFVLFSGPV